MIQRTTRKSQLRFVLRDCPITKLIESKCQLVQIHQKSKDNTVRKVDVVLIKKRLSENVTNRIIYVYLWKDYNVRELYAKTVSGEIVLPIQKNFPTLNVFASKIHSG
ncbi:hypothetical protein CEXT_187401 [Caerostris extrusa]|uniref:Uncharacterized protein n=1 Tax=Caerostris extrusa TaxID=172846 RepID=A0AAV4S9J3_CAEEX|nr:hypothetical protein CEXT_187401 [Caerostris extrusa]